MLQFDEDTWLPQWPKGFKPNYRYTRPTYEKHVGKSGKTWLIPSVTRLPNRGDHIYVTAYKDIDRAGPGFGGRTIVLPLMDGTDFELHGGWHSRPVDLLEDTGIDAMNQHLTYGAVGLHRVKGQMWIYGILHEDAAPTIGRFDRIERIAQDIANERNEQVAYGSLSLGGSVSGVIKPEGR